jgi:hypothetical protein
MLNNGKVEVCLKEDVDETLAEKDKQLRHNKSKRCLAIAKWCLTEKVYFHYRYDDWGDKGYDRSYKWKKVVFWSKWARRWLELAEKFNEAKDGSDISASKV